MLHLKAVLKEDNRVAGILEVFRPSAQEVLMIIHLEILGANLKDVTAHGFLKYWKFQEILNN